MTVVAYARVSTVCAGCGAAFELSPRQEKKLKLSGGPFRFVCSQRCAGINSVRARGCPRGSQPRIARDHLNYLVETGKLVRPEVCEKCGERPGLNRAGRSNIHGHHPRGHDDPLDVEWLCAKCHRREPEHAARGERHGGAKLTEAQVRQIKEDIASGAALRSIARAFSVCQSTIQRIQRGRGWVHV